MSRRSAWRRIIVARIFEFIASIRARGVAVLLVEQNARLALRSADYAYMLDQGRMVLEGPAGELAGDERVASRLFGRLRSGTGSD